MRECLKCDGCFDDEAPFCPVDGSETRIALPGPRLLAGRYSIERRLGRGAMGQVYLALDSNLGTRRVAVKTVRQDILGSEQMAEGEAIARFEREARSAASIQHPNVVSVTDFGETRDGVFYLVMEYVEGETLHRLLRREGTLSLKRATSLLRQIASGVEAAHDAGILHRDLKPANIFIMQSAKQRADGFVKVGDFGLAKIVGESSQAGESGPSSRGIIGTPEFMSPEQMQPELGVDTRADLYAMGTIAYLMLGGRTPFVGDLMQLVMQKMMQVPPPLNSLRGDVPKEVEAVIMRALEADPAKRHTSVGEWIDDLESAVARQSISVAETDGSRLVILAPTGAEVYVDDERKGSVGGSGRLVLSSVPPGRHVLRVSAVGVRDDERLIELREGGEEQVIQANLPMRGEARGTPSRPNGPGSERSSMGSLPSIVACGSCGARFASGVRFCGRCGGREFKSLETSTGGGVSCRVCGATQQAGRRFCGKCGSAVGPSASHASHPSGAAEPVGVICKWCGKSVATGTRFCGSCGKSVG